MNNTRNFQQIMSAEWMNTTEFIAIPEVFCQRDTGLRMKKSRDRLATVQAEHAVTSIAELTKEDTLDGVTYPAGTRWRLDANTRAALWEEGMTDAVPEKVLVIKYLFDSIKRIQESYWTFDSVDATESTGEAFYGILKTLGYIPYTSKVKKGHVQTALAYAVEVFYSDKGLNAKRKSDLQEMTRLMLTQIEMFDRVVCQNMDSWDQALICLAFFVLKKYGSVSVEGEYVVNPRALEGLARIDTKQAISGIGVDYDGISMIVEEWKKPKDTSNIPRGTKWADFRIQMDFLCLCFDKWMGDETMKVYRRVKDYHKRWA